MHNEALHTNSVFFTKQIEQRGYRESLSILPSGYVAEFRYSEVISGDDAVATTSVIATILILFH